MRSFTFSILLISALILAACSDDSSMVENPQPENRGAFTNLRLSRTVFDTDTIDFTGLFDKTPADPITIPILLAVNAVNQSGATIASARVMILTEGGEEVVVFDSIITRTGTEDFSARIPMRIRRGDVGDYRLQITGFDSRGLELSPTLSWLKVSYGAEPPVLSDLVAPDTVDRPASGSKTFDLSVRCTDKAGRKNIKKVFFNSYDPQGMLDPDGPFDLIDDGLGADRAFGDSVYSRRLTITDQNTPGVYRFEFSALNRSNLAGNVIIHYIYVR